MKLIVDPTVSIANAAVGKVSLAIMGNAVAEGDERARKAIGEAMNSPLLEDNDIRGAQHILLNITSGKNEVTMSEIGEITEYVQEEAGYGTNLIWGSCHDPSLGEKLSVTLIATGFKTNHVTDQKIEDEKIRIPLDESKGLSEENGISVGLDSGDAVRTVDFEVDDVRKTIEELNHNSEYYKPRQKQEPHVKEVQSTEREHYIKMEQARRTHMRKNLAMSLDDPKLISEMENEPAYKRRNVILDDTKEIKARADLSRFEISSDPDEPLRRSNNSFLHENVD